MFSAIKPNLNLQELFYSNPAGIVYLNAEGKFITANPAAEDIFGIPFSKNNNYPDCLSCPRFLDENGNELPKSEYPSQVALRTGKTVKNRFVRLFHKLHGEIRTIKIDAIPQFRDGETEPYQVFISCQDVTHQKKTEQDLIHSEQKYRALVDNMYSSMIIIQDGEVKFANKALTELSGYDFSEILNRNFIDFVDPREKTKVSLFYSERINGKKAPEIYRTRVVKKSGQVLYVHLKVKAINFANQPAVLVIITDVDDQVKSEIKLLESEEKFRSIVQSINDGIVYIDEDATILHINKSFAKLFDIQAEQLIGQNANEMARSFAKRNKIPEFMSFIAQSLKGVSLSPAELKYKNRILEVSCSFAPTTKRKVIVIRDLTLQKQTEKELSILSRRASDALHGANLGTWEWNIQTGKIIFNERCVEIIGYSLVEASGWNMKTWKALAHREDARKSEKLMQEHFHKNLDYYECEMRMLHKNGKWIWVLEKGKVAVWSKEGKPIMISGTQQDITDRKRAEREVQESERRLSTLMDNLPGIAYRCKNARDWPMEFISNGCRELTGYSASEIIGEDGIKFGDLIHPEDRNPGYEEIQQALAENKPFEIEYRIKTADGKEKIVWEKGVGVFKDGKLLFLEGFIHDITADKKAEDRLRNQEQLLRQIAENYPNSFVSIINKDLQVILSAGQEFKNQKLNPDEQIGLKPEDLYGDEAETVKNYYQRTFQGEECDFELFLSNKYLSFRTVPILNHNNIINRILVVIENVSEKKQMWNDLVTAKEKAEESDKLKSAFLTTMNHELRTPLNHVIGFSEIIRDATSDENIKEFAETIFQSGKGLLEIIEDIFDLAFTEKSIINVRLSTIRVDSLYQEMKNSLKELVHDSGKEGQIKLILKPQKELLSRKIICDRNKLVQVAINLFKNAIKFTSNGFIEFGINQQNNTLLNIYVKDSGIGIAEDKKKVIFEFFRQADDTNSRKFGGVGIGLAISKKITEAMDGKILVESELGKGALFTIQIPIDIL